MVGNVISTSDSNNGFSAKIDLSDVRRQLRMSIGVVVMVSIGVVSAATVVGSHPLAAKRDVVSMKPVTTMHAETNVSGARPI